MQIDKYTYMGIFTKLTAIAKSIYKVGYMNDRAEPSQLHEGLPKLLILKTKLQYHQKFKKIVYLHY